MKSYHRVLVSIFICIGAIAFAAEHQDSEIVRTCRDLESLHRVTEQPHLMLDSTITFCRPPEDLPHNVHEAFAETAFCNVYVNELAKPVMLAGRGDYPIGSLIVKSKLRSIDTGDDVRSRFQMPALPRTAMTPRHRHIVTTPPHATTACRSLFISGGRSGLDPVSQPASLMRAPITKAP